jgi:hypothetical protein
MGASATVSGPRTLADGGAGGYGHGVVAGIVIGVVVVALVVGTLVARRRGYSGMGGSQLFGVS